MSDIDLARRASIELLFDGVDITKPLHHFFQSATYTDNESNEIDDLQIRLVDRENIWLRRWLNDALQAEHSDPAGFTIGASILQQNWRTDGKDVLLECGQFSLDDVIADGPPTNIILGATALPFGSKIRQTKKNKTYKKKRLSAIAREIAAGGGMSVIYESSYDPLFDEIEQDDISDIEFLLTLCRNAGLTLKVTDNTLVLYSQIELDKQPASIDIVYGDGTYDKYRFHTGSAHSKYTSCRVRNSKRTVAGIAHITDMGIFGTGQQLEVTENVKSVAEAEKTALNRLWLANRLAFTAQFKMSGGDPKWRAGIAVNLIDWGVLWSGKYIIMQAIHTVRKSGYSTDIKLRRVLEVY